LTTVDEYYGKIETEDTETEDIEASLYIAVQAAGVLIVTTGGYGKRVPVSQFKPVQSGDEGRLPQVPSVDFKTSWRPCTLTEARMMNNDASRGIIVKLSAISPPRSAAECRCLWTKR